MMKRLKVEPKRVLTDRVPDLRDLWRPYLTFLKCLGIVNCRSDFSSNPWKDPWTLVSLVCLLNTVTMLLIRFEILKVLEATTKGEIANYLICLIAVFTETISMAVLFFSSVCGNGFNNIFVVWSQLRLEFSSSQRLCSRVRMTSWCLLVIFLVLSLTQVTAYFLILYWRSWIFKWTIVPLSSFYFRLGSLFTSVHMVGFITLVCATLWLLFAEVNSVIDTADILGYHANIKAFSAIFRHAAAIVSAFDKVLAFMIGPYLISYICQVVFNTYLVFGDPSSEVNSANRYWLVESVVMLLIVSLLPAFVSVQAHRSYQVLCQVATEDMPMPLMLLVNGLQNRLSISPIGLSAFHIRVITVNLIPTVISIYFTYIVLIIQFRTSDVHSEDYLMYRNTNLSAASLL